MLRARNAAFLVLVVDIASCSSSAASAAEESKKSVGKKAALLPAMTVLQKQQMNAFDACISWVVKVPGGILKPVQSHALDDIWITGKRD